MSNEFGIKRIIEKRTAFVKNKPTTEYFVDWEPSWVAESEVTKSAIVEFNRTQANPKVLGPHKPSMNGKADKTKWEWIVQIGDEYEVVPYDVITTTYNAEFIKYCLDHMDAK